MSIKKFIVGDSMERKIKNNRVIGSIIQVILIYIIPFLICAVFGMLPQTYLEDEMEYFLTGIIIPILLIYICYIVSIILHELGHLIRGLRNRGSLIEYNFLFFSIYKENDKIKFKVKGLTTGLGGICIMDFPHDIKESEYKKFCFGGPCVNFILTIIFIIVIVFSLNNNTMLLISLYMISINLGIGITNLMPFETITGMETDGMKLYRLKHEKNYIDNLSKMLKIQEFLKKGGEFKDIPTDIIYKPDHICNKSDMEMMIFYISKIIELAKYDEAEKLINECLNNYQNKLSMSSKCNLKISLIDVYLKTNSLKEINEIYDESLFKYIEMLSKFEKSVSVYVYLYYIITNAEAKSNKIKKELEEYYESNSNSSLTTDSKSIYNLINERYK